MSGSIPCPHCGSRESKVVDSRDGTHDSIRRRRQCRHCNKRYTTHELLTDTWDKFNAPSLPYLEITARRALLAWLAAMPDLQGPAND